jgi:hypothetical protein
MAQAYTSISLPKGFGELPDSPCEAIGDKGWEATVNLLVPWLSRGLVLDDIVGNMRLYPHLNGKTAAYAISGCSKPYQGQASLSTAVRDTAEYQAAILTIKYGRLSNNQNQKGTEIYSESLDFSDQHLTMEPIDYQWNHDGDDTSRAAVVRESPVMLVKGFEYTQVRYNQKKVPTTILDLLGSVNSVAYPCQMLGITLPAESMLFDPPKMTRKVTTTGAALWTITYKVSGKLPGWNRFWNPRGKNTSTNAYTGAWEYLYPAGSSLSGASPVKFYTPKSWSSIFV